MSEKLKVLLIEDQDIYVNLIQSLIPTEKYEVAVCRNAEDALAAYEDTFFPIILADIGLPGIDGLEFCRRIRKNYISGQDSIVIVITGQTDVNQLSEVLDVGADDYLTKPIDIQLFNIRLEIAAKQARTLLEKRSTKIAFKESEKKLWAILTSLRDTIIIVFDNNLNNVFSWADVLLDSQYGLKINGGEALIADLSSYLIKNYVLTIQNIFSSGETATKNFTYDFPNGKFYFNLCFSPMFCVEGKTCAVITFITDVTRQVRSENAQKEQVRFLQNLIDSIPNPIFYKDEKLQYRGFNKAFLEYLGKSAGEILGKGVFDISPPDLARKYYEMDRSIIENPKKQKYEWQTEAPNKTRKHVVFYKAPFFKPDGSIGGIVGIIHDITERKELENKLRELQQKLDKYESQNSKLNQE